jgi:Cys-tRNA(Pro)/Cys-tRNA(Cys) deacylase
MKTNATRQLDTLGLSYQLREYKVDADELGALKVASQIGLPPEQVFKTLCARGNDGAIVFALIPGDCDLDLKALARLSGKHAVSLVPVSQLKQLTGYIRGGVTALASKKDYPVYIDASVLQHAIISVSAGVRGTQILLAPRDYIQSTGAILGTITRESATDRLPPAPRRW